MEVGSRPLAEHGPWPFDALGGSVAGMGCATRMWGGAAHGLESGCRGHIHIEKNGIWGIYMMDIVRGYYCSLLAGADSIAVKAKHRRTKGEKGKAATI